MKGTVNLEKERAEVNSEGIHNHNKTNLYALDVHNDFGNKREFAATTTRHIHTKYLLHVLNVRNDFARTSHVYVLHTCM